MVSTLLNVCRLADRMIRWERKCVYFGLCTFIKKRAVVKALGALKALRPEWSVLVLEVD